MTLNNTHGKKRLIIPVILAGGSGTRLWPLSRKNYPKALLKLRDDRTLLQNILSKIKSIPHLSTPLVIGNIEYGAVIADQLKQIRSKATVLLETESYNTAIATLLAAQYAIKKVDNPLLLILPIDQDISDLSQFAKMLTKAAKIAIKNKFVIFGVEPDSAATGYGYIKKGAKFSLSSGHLVKQFIEKPDLKKAKAYFKSGNYYWNSGIFLFLASTFIAELALHSPKVFIAAKKITDTMQPDKKTIHLNTHLIKRCPSISIDEAILESTKNAVVFPFKGGWHDMGNWNSLYDVTKKDKEGNAVTKNVVSFATKNSYLYSSKQLLVTAGVNNLLVVITKDAVLIANRDKVQDIKKIVSFLVKKKYAEATMSTIVYQPWGCYEITDKSRHYQIKHFFINPKGVFASNTNRHCSTYWIIVSGKARISTGKKTNIASKNQSIAMSKGINFEVENISNIQLHFIEICSSSI